MVPKRGPTAYEAVAPPNTLKTPYRDGSTHVIFEPEDFIARLAALVPKPRAHLTPYSFASFLYIRIYTIKKPHIAWISAAAGRPRN
jgi:hypothetical protein